MPNFTDATPKTVGELYSNLLKLHENRKHIDSMTVNGSSNYVEVDLDWSANKMGGVPDFRIAVKPTKIQEAKILVERFMSSSKVAPTMNEADQLFKLLDLSR